MASPHAAGLAALLLSGLVAEKGQIEARRIRQALMVTARPLPAGSYLDDGTGQPDVAAAWRWLVTGRNVTDISVRALNHGVTAAYQERLLGNAPDTAPAFEVSLPAGMGETDMTLRSSAPWLRAPGKVRLRSGANTISLSYHSPTLRQPGVYAGVVTAWTSDTLAGPAFRLVNTVVVADTASPLMSRLGRIPAGGEGRVFFEAKPNLPFAVTFATEGPGEQVLAYLHEPGGQPYREENGIGAGSGEQAGSYVVDARDVVPGLYEAVAVAPPLEGAAPTIVVDRSRLMIDATRERDGIAVRLSNVTPDAVTSEPFVVLVGGERTATFVARGFETQRLRFQLPDWAVHATVDVRMDRAQWPLFTDFGVTLLDADGRQLGKSPLNYAFGRLHADLRRGGAIRAGAEVALFPGFADPRADQRWTATVSVRLYADSAHVVRLPEQSVTVDPGREARALLPMPAFPLLLGDAFVPLGIVVVPDGDRTWTREVPLPAPVTPLGP